MALDHTETKGHVEGTAALDGLAHALSHDLRAVFRSTQGFAQVIQSRTAAKLPTEDAALLQRIIDASQRGTAMLDGLVTWLRTEHHTLNPRPVDLAFLLDWSASEQPRCKIDLAIEGDATVTGDEHLLKRLFDVVLDNACRFAGPDATHAEVNVRIQRVDGNTHIRLHDHGIGIDAAHAGRAFEPFTRLHPDSNVAGQGLGLAIAQNIVLKHGGTLSIAPHTERGTVVEITLPVPESP